MRELALQKSPKVLQFEEQIKYIANIDKEEAKQMAKTLIMWQGELCPEAIDTPQKAYTIQQYGRELGIGMVNSFKSIFIIDMKPSLEGGLMASIARAKGITWKTIQNYEKATEPTPGMIRTFVNRTTTIEFYDKNGMKEIGTFDTARACKIPHGKKGMLIDKWNWKVWQPEMLWWRAWTQGVRKMGILGGYYSPDELNAMMDDKGNRVEDKRISDFIVENQGKSAVDLADVTVETPDRKPTIEEWTKNNLEEIKKALADTSSGALGIVTSRVKVECGLAKNYANSKLLKQFNSFINPKT